MTPFFAVVGDIVKEIRTYLARARFEPDQTSFRDWFSKTRHPLL